MMLWNWLHHNRTNSSQFHRFDDGPLDLKPSQRNTTRITQPLSLPSDRDNRDDSRGSVISKVMNHNIIEPIKSVPRKESKDMHIIILFLGFRTKMV